MDTQYNYTPEPEQTPVFPMKWHKFLIYFATWAGALIMLSNAVRFFTGSVEASASEIEYLYRLLPGLKGIHMFMGVLCVAAAVLAVVTRFALAGFKANGPTLLTALYASNMLVNPLYLVLVSVVCSVPLGELMNSTMITSIVMPIIMIVANKKYYDKRAVLFNK